MGDISLIICTLYIIYFTLLLGHPSIVKVNKIWRKVGKHYH